MTAGMVMYDFVVESVPYFSWKNWTRITCAHCDKYVSWSADEKAAEWDFLQHFQTVHQK